MSHRNPPPEQPASDLRVVRALRRFTVESDLYVGAAGREGAMHRTDLNGLSLVMDWDGETDAATPGRIGAALGLSAPATSALLERLESAGHITRSPHPRDRRSVVVSVTDHAMEVGSSMFSSLAEHLAPVVAERSDAELAVIADFLEAVGEATAAARVDVEGRQRSAPAEHRPSPR